MDYFSVTFSASYIVTPVDGKTSHWIIHSNDSQLVSRIFHSTDLFTTPSHQKVETTYTVCVVDCALTSFRTILEAGNFSNWKYAVFKSYSILKKFTELVWKPYHICFSLYSHWVMCLARDPFFHSAHSLWTKWRQELRASGPQAVSLRLLAANVSV